MDQPIGPRLRQIRLRHGLSQRQLARQSGVANATISQIEAGKLNPTVSMLKKVLDGIPLVRDAVKLPDYRLETVGRELLGRGKLEKALANSGADIFVSVKSSEPLVIAPRPRYSVST